MIDHSISRHADQGEHLHELERLRVGELLGKVTRAERRILLGVAMLAIAVGHTGLIPSKIAALGIEFEHADQRALLVILAVIVTYFTVAFAIYATADFLAWRAAHDDALLMHPQNEHAFVPIADAPGDKPPERIQKKIWRRRWRWGTLARKTSYVRAAWEFVLPIAVGFYAIGVVLWARYHIP